MILDLTYNSLKMKKALHNNSSRICFQPKKIVRIS